jgi:hypothetical protein
MISVRTISWHILCVCVCVLFYDVDIWSISIEWWDEWWIGNDLEGSGYLLIEELSKNLCGGTEESRENFNEDSQRPSWNSNGGPPEYKSRAIMLDKSVWCDTFSNQILLMEDLYLSDHKLNMNSVIMQNMFIVCQITWFCFSVMS